MEIEKGTDTHQRFQVTGGRWDGAWGTIVTANAEQVVVELDNGQQVLLGPEAIERGSADDSFPRERGS